MRHYFLGPDSELGKCDATMARLLLAAYCGGLRGRNATRRA